MLPAALKSELSVTLSASQEAEHTFELLEEVGVKTPSLLTSKFF
ncbi:hypothetical protein NEOC95_000477 [Neochlamydia sp. AcF95]|nr:hypothetical protein [Neochlamydia sp. AcF95]